MINRVSERLVRFVEVDGAWHELTDEQDETVCGLDYDLHAEMRDEGFRARRSPPADTENRCPTCFAKD